MGLAPEITDDAANLKVFSKPQRSCLPLLALSRQWSVLLVSLHVLFDVSIVGIFVYQNNVQANLFIPDTAKKIRPVHRGFRCIEVILKMIQMEWYRKMCPVCTVYRFTEGPDQTDFTVLIFFKDFVFCFSQIFMYVLDTLLCLFYNDMFCCRFLPS